MIPANCPEGKTLRTRVIEWAHNTPLLCSWDGEFTDIPEIDNLYRQAELVWEGAHTSISRAVGRFKRFADQQWRETPAWLSSRDLNLHLPSHKLSPRYLGTFEIIKQMNHLN